MENQALNTNYEKERMHLISRSQQMVHISRREWRHHLALKIDMPHALRMQTRLGRLVRASDRSWLCFAFARARLVHPHTSPSCGSALCLQPSIYPILRHQSRATTDTTAI